MNSRKITTKQERFELVARFLKSGQSHIIWCQENDIKPNTLYRWRMEYKTIQQKVCFVPLKAKASKGSAFTLTEKTTNDILIELGACKVHLPEHLAVSLLTDILKEAVNTHV